MAPRSPKHFLATDGFPLVFDNVNEPIKGNEPKLYWHLWNLDDTYPHTPWLAAEWISSDEPINVKTYRVIRDLVDLWRSLLGPRRLR